MTAAQLLVAMKQAPLDVAHNEVIVICAVEDREVPSNPSVRYFSVDSVITRSDGIVVITLGKQVQYR